MKSSTTPLSTENFWAIASNVYLEITGKYKCDVC